MGRYLRYAALGDSATFGLGDPVPGGWRGWASLLAQALATTYDVSFCNVAMSGATSATVVDVQLADAVAHRPDLASLVVGLNDVLKSGWDPVKVHADLVECASTLTGQGACLLTARFHDHGRILPLPAWVRRRLARRVMELNEVWDDIHATYGGVRVDLAARPEVWERRFWSVDRIHPSELGHRALAHAFAGELHGVGLDFEPPGLASAGGIPPSWQRDVAWLVAEGPPWLGRRARDFGPWAVRLAMREARPAWAARAAVGPDHPPEPVGLAR